MRMLPESTAICRGEKPPLSTGLGFSWQFSKRAANNSALPAFAARIRQLSPNIVSFAKNHSDIPELDFADGSNPDFKIVLNTLEI